MSHLSWRIAVGAECRQVRDRCMYVCCVGAQVEHNYYTYICVFEHVLLCSDVDFFTTFNFNLSLATGASIECENVTR